MRRLLFALIPAGLLLLAGELAGRAFTEPLLRTGPVFAHGFPGVPFVRAGPNRMRARFQDPDPSTAFAEMPEAGVPRVFVFGESSVRGGVRGIRADMEFPAVLMGRLIPSLGRVEVLNFGKPGVEMAEITPIARASAPYLPDLVVLYAGHNAVGNATMRALAPAVHPVPERLEALGLYRMVRLIGAWARPPPPPLLPPPSDVGKGFADALDPFLDLWARAGVEVVLTSPISNVWTWPAGTPVCPEVSRAAWQIAPTGAWSIRAEVPETVAERMYAQAPACPEVCFVWGRARYARGEEREGLALLEQARDHDPLPLRANTTILEVIRARSARPGVRFVDVAALWPALGPGVRDRFHDLLHFSVSGHAAMADTLLPTVRAALDARRGAPAQ